jgi:hypothetical protein
VRSAPHKSRPRKKTSPAKKKSLGEEEQEELMRAQHLLGELRDLNMGRRPPVPRRTLQNARPLASRASTSSINPPPRSPPQLSSRLSSVMSNRSRLANTRNTESMASMRSESSFSGTGETGSSSRRVRPVQHVARGNSFKVMSGGYFQADYGLNSVHEYEHKKRHVGPCHRECSCTLEGIQDNVPKHKFLERKLETWPLRPPRAVSPDPPKRGKKPFKKKVIREPYTGPGWNSGSAEPRKGERASHWLSLGAPPH